MTCMFEHVVLFQDVQSLFMYVGLNVLFYSSLGIYSTLKEFYPHSQTYHKRTPLGPSVAVRLPWGLGYGSHAFYKKSHLNITGGF